MPIWFVSWAELEEAIDDDVLTITELEGLSSLLRGQATSYSETLHPTGVAPQTVISIVASGFLEDGREFAYQATAAGGTYRHVKITFK